MEEKNLHLLEKMVNIDSGTGDREGLAQVAELVRRRAETLGWSFRVLPGDNGTEHYYISRGGGDRLLMIAHLDTVFPEGTAAARPFRIDGDLARGPGVSDCKSGVVTILGALARLAPNEAAGHEIACLFNTDEEIGSLGSRRIIEELAGASQAVVVVEPAEGETLTVARKGIGRFQMEVFGKAAHSGSNYTDGHNAILELAHKVIAIHGLTDLDAGITLNAGVIKGGSKANVVPDYAAAQIDLRIKTPGQRGEMIERLRQIAARNQVAGVSARLSGGITRPPMERTESNLRLYERFRRAGAAIGLTLASCESGGGSDANFAAALGVPVIDGVGPIGGGHHSEAEYLVISSLYRRIDLLAEFLKYTETRKHGNHC
jgi:glutamate carboxypeptidase